MAERHILPPLSLSLSLSLSLVCTVAHAGPYLYLSELPASTSTARAGGWYRGIISGLRLCYQIPPRWRCTRPQPTCNSTIPRFPGIPGERKAIKRSWTKRKERESPGKKSKRPANELVAKRVPVSLQGFQIRPLFFATSIPADASIRQSPPRMRCTAEKFSAYAYS